MLIIGADPGKQGGMAALDGDEVVAVLKNLGKRTDVEILMWLRELVQDQQHPPRAYVEKVAASPQMGVRSAFTFGREFGRLCACVVGAGCSLELVSPQRWQRDLGCLTGGDKNVTKDFATQRWPMQSVTHSIADALCIAEWGRKYGWPARSSSGVDGGGTIRGRKCSKEKNSTSIRRRGPRGRS